MPSPIRCGRVSGPAMLRGVIALLTALVFSACSDGPTRPDPDPDPDPTRVATVSVSPVSLTLKVDSVSVLLATAWNEAGDDLTGDLSSASFEWSTSDGSVVSLDGDGEQAVVRALRPGQAVITVKVSDLRARTTITAEEPPAPTNNHEPNDTPTQAGAIALGASQVQAIQPATDEDWVRFSITQPSSVLLEITTASGGANTFMELFSGSTLLASDDDGGPGSLSRIETSCNAQPLTPGEYLARITSYQRQSTIQSYTIKFTSATVCPPPTSPALQLSATALSLSNGTPQGAFSIANIGTGTLSWSVTDDVAWLSASPASGSVTTTPAPVTVSATVSGLAPGTHTGHINVTSNGGNAQVTVTLTVTPPTSQVTVVVDNRLRNRVNVFANGTVIGSVPAQTTAQQTITAPASLTVSWELVRTTTTVGTPVGDQMGGSFAPVTNPVGTLTYTVDNVVGTSVYFNPVINNNTAVSLLMAVNWQLQAENRCNCTVPALQQNITIGYYRLFSNTRVVAFRDGTGYTGSYLYWENFTNVQPGTGLTLLAANIAPGPVGSLIAGQTLAVAEGSSWVDPRPDERWRSGTDDLVLAPVFPTVVRSDSRPINSQPLPGREARKQRDLLRD